MLSASHTSLMARTEDEDYLRKVEAGAQQVVERATEEGWLSYASDPVGATGLQRAVNDLARSLRHVHFDGDGCLDH
jgi:hypothetical protein